MTRRENVLPLLTICAIAAAVVVAMYIGRRHRQTPDEFCRGHGGVKIVSAGGWGHPSVATCSDGHAGRVYP